MNPVNERSSTEIFAEKITLGMMKLPFQIFPLTVKIISFPFDAISNSFFFAANKTQQAANICIPRPLNYLYAMPLYITGACFKIPVLPLKLMALPFESIVKVIDSCGNLALAQRAELQHS